MPSLKTDHGSKLTSPTASQQNISNLEDGLPLVGHRRHGGSPRVLPGLTIGIGVCVVVLTGAVVYLVVTSYLVQKHLDAVQLELENANERMDWLERIQPDLRSHNSSIEKNSREKSHKLRKREVPRSNAEHSHSKKKSEKKKTLSDLYDELKTLKEDLKNLRHPSAHMVLPTTSDDVDYSIEHFPSTAGNGVVTWEVKHNALFDTNDSAHFLVRTPGAYFVYLQITYNGRDRRGNPTCSHVVKSENPEHNRTRLLLYGSATQYNLGGMIRILGGGEVLNPIDTVHVSGIFHLLPGDRLHVEPDSFSRECVVSGFTDKTFFGAFRLQSLLHDPDPRGGGDHL